MGAVIRVVAIAAVLGYAAARLSPRLLGEQADARDADEGFGFAVGAAFEVPTSAGPFTNMTGSGVRVGRPSSSRVDSD